MNDNNYNRFYYPLNVFYESNELAVSACILDLLQPALSIHKIRISGLVNKGYKSTKFPKNKDGLIRVTFGSFNTKEDAVIALRSIRDNENKYAWILTISNQ